MIHPYTMLNILYSSLVPGPWCQCLTDPGPIRRPKPKP